MNEDNLKVKISWKDIVIEIPITEEQRDIIVQRTLLLVHGHEYIEKRRIADSVDYLLQEEEHLRKLLLQLHQNRRILEQQIAFGGMTETPLRIVNELAEVNRYIDDITHKIDVTMKVLKTSLT
jgi:hypothetical protein